MVLLYHLIFPDDTPKGSWNAGLVLRMSQFKRHIFWLQQRFQILKLEDYVSLYRKDPVLLRGKIAITFDDGYRSVVDLVASFFKYEQIPATFFCTTRHLEQQDLLWFVYLNALCSERSYDKIILDGSEYQLDSRKPALETWRKLIKDARESGDPIGFARDLDKRYPLPETVKRKYEGLTKEQMAEIGSNNLLSLGCHTHNHPYLDQLLLEDQIHEMQVNKRILEEVSASQVDFFAYTGGVYNNNSLKAVHAMGFSAAFAVNPKYLGNDSMMEIPRTDIYSPSLGKLKMRTSTITEKLRRFVLRNQ